MTKHNIFTDTNEYFKGHQRADDFDGMRDMLDEGAGALGLVNATAAETGGRVLNRIKVVSQTAIMAAERVTQSRDRTPEEDAMIDDGGPVLPSEE